MSPLPVVLAAAAGVALAGCGGGGRLSHDGFVHKGNDICSTYAEKVRSLGRPKSLDDLAPLVRRAVSLSRQELRELEELKPPADEERRFRAFLSQARYQVGLTDDLATAIARGDARRTQQLLRFANQAEPDTNRLARRAGLTLCALPAAG